MQGPAGGRLPQWTGNPRRQIRGSGILVSREKPLIGGEFLGGDDFCSAGRAVELDFLALLQGAKVTGLSIEAQSTRGRHSAPAHLL